MKRFIKALFITIAIGLIGCQNSNKELTITNIQFMDYIHTPIIEEGRWMNYNNDLLILKDKELEEYKLNLLGKKVNIEHFDKAIKIRIGTDNQARIILLENNGNNNYCNATIDANIERKLFNEIITLKINAHHELKYLKSLYSLDSIAQEDYYMAKEMATMEGRDSEIEELDYKLDERYFSEKGIVITIKNKQ